MRATRLRGSVCVAYGTCVCSCVCAAFLLSRVQTHTNTHTHHTIPLSLPFHIHSYIHFTSSHFTHTPERGTTTTRYFTLTFISHSSHTPERGHHHPIGDRDIHRYSQRFFQNPHTSGAGAAVSPRAAARTPRHYLHGLTAAVFCCSPSTQLALPKGNAC